MALSCLLDRRGRRRPARVARRRPLSRALLGGFGGVDEAEHVVRGGGDVLRRRQAAPFLHLHSNSKPRSGFTLPTGLDKRAGSGTGIPDRFGRKPVQTGRNQI